VGKVLRVYHSTAEVLRIDDQSSGVGAILNKTRLQGILNGTPSGELVLGRVMSDETVPAGELVLTSGGDSIFPKGLPIGTVTKVAPGSELFLNIHVRPAADLSKLEEVLVVTKIDERQAEPDHTGAARAVDILAERLPGVPSKPENAGTGTEPGAAQPTGEGSPAQPKVLPNTAPVNNGAFAAKAAPKTAPSSTGGSGTSHGTASTASNPAVAATEAVKVAPKPAKPAVAPKPEPVVEDSPH